MNPRIGTALLTLLVGSGAALGVAGLTQLCAAVARGFFPVAAVIFVVTSTLGLVTRFRA
jgi:hypothetical protein